ncbi:hypothetical protein RRG08_017486 [Elysia crispata]|uniref:Uncharacterized protein n=1 Tax=Elysia crispata TaxID=231223 RepID=A0AAE0YI66_9GAST|nr:hypothetical protein RRG08_017486 [Elysia crispata]
MRASAATNIPRRVKRIGDAEAEAIPIKPSYLCQSTKQRDRLSLPVPTFTQRQLFVALSTAARFGDDFHEAARQPDCCTDSKVYRSVLQST